MVEVTLKIQGIKGVFKTLHRTHALASAYAARQGGVVSIKKLF